MNKRKNLPNILINLTKSTLESLGGWDFILKALSLVGIQEVMPVIA